MTRSIESSDTGPGTIVGLAGNDCILATTAFATVDGGFGEDTVVLQAGNSGTVTGGTRMTASLPPAISARWCCSVTTVPTPSPRPRRPSQIILGGNNYCRRRRQPPRRRWHRSGLRQRRRRHAVLGERRRYADRGLRHQLVLFLDTSASHLSFGIEGNDTFNISGGSDTIFVGHGNDSSCRIPGAVNFRQRGQRHLRCRGHVRRHNPRRR